MKVQKIVLGKLNYIEFLARDNIYKGAVLTASYEGSQFYFRVFELEITKGLAFAKALIYGDWRYSLIAIGDISKLKDFIGSELTLVEDIDLIDKLHNSNNNL